MPRHKLIIEYDGSGYRGWQKQAHAFSIQETIENAIFAFSQQRVCVEGAGRTDTGVHALAQVAHFDSVKEYPCHRIQDALNAHLRESRISILAVETVDLDFHARFSATARIYTYCILNRRAPLALEKNRAWHVLSSLDVTVMHEAAQALVGRHDFSSFRSAACQASSALRTLDYFEIRQEKELITATVQSRSFLHNQVRIMMGTLKEVGAGSLSPQQFEEILHQCNRAAAGPTAPACGLYLTKILYT